MTLFFPEYRTRRWLKVGLVVGGALTGAVFGIVLTRLGKIVGGAPPADLRNYLWNAGVFALMAAVLSPLVTWSALRRAPLWRTLVEPLGYAIAGGAAAVVLGIPALILIGPPVGLIFGFTRLGQRYPEQRILPAAK